ncbi:Uncharacterised protein [Mycobacteroides abscessus subsp. abscessus]|nr:Uncharacterised protein [Mycobacteroides abscessus subsp. abscessus]
MYPGGYDGYTGVCVGATMMRRPFPYVYHWWPPTEEAISPAPLWSCCTSSGGDCSSIADCSVASLMSAVFSLVSRVSMLDESADSAPSSSDVDVGGGGTMPLKALLPAAPAAAPPAAATSTVFIRSSSPLMFAIVPA